MVSKAVVALIGCLALGACNGAHMAATGDGDTSAEFTSLRAEAPAPVRERTLVGYVKQTSRVSTGCLVPEIVAILGKLERHYGKAPIVTSGCRNGRGRSLHNSGRAADIRVDGVSTKALHDHLRAMPEVGGTGTYGRGSVVHFDVGAPRMWSVQNGRRVFRMLTARN